MRSVLPWESLCQPFCFTVTKAAAPQDVKTLALRLHSVHGTGCLRPTFSFLSAMKNCLGKRKARRFWHTKKARPDELKREKRFHLFGLFKTLQSLLTAAQLEQASSLWRSQHCSSLTSELGKCPSACVSHPDRPAAKAALPRRKA